MGNVIGPFSKGDIVQMQVLKNDIQWMRNTNRLKFDVAISKEDDLLREYYGRQVA